MTHPTLQYMVSEVDQRERRAVAEAARRIPGSHPGPVARLLTRIGDWSPRSVAPAVVAQPITTIRRLIVANS